MNYVDCLNYFLELSSQFQVSFFLLPWVNNIELLLFFVCSFNLMQTQELPLKSKGCNVCKAVLGNAVAEKHLASKKD